MAVECILVLGKVEFGKWKQKVKSRAIISVPLLNRHRRSTCRELAVMNNDEPTPLC